MEFQIILQASTKSLRPTIPASTPKPLADLITHCLAETGSQRPTAAHVAETLTEIQKEYWKDTSAWEATIEHDL
jgi:hypothetical protein